MWTKAYPDGCKLCSRTDRPHYGQGICTGCIYAARKNGIYQPRKNWKKIRIKDGVQEHRCIVCEKWKITDEFYPLKSLSGRTGRCKECKREADQKRYWNNPEAERKRAKIRYDKLFSREATVEFMQKELKRRKVDSYNAAKPMVPFELVSPWLNLLLEESRDQTTDGKVAQMRVAEWVGISARRVWGILNPKEGYQTSYDTAEKIALRAGTMQELNEFLELPGIEGWSKQGARYCDRCGTWERPHVAKNLCGRCYSSFSRYRTAGKEMPAFAKIDCDMQKFWKKKRNA